ncbi:hypothetical protein ACFWN5_19635 [Streptomyces sp. NPDC058430]|uniref:hypothetical protein n=1 Tax=Streptomyces sp. NPDC058430 TaxID=3346495 RepID=UPI003667552B
MNARPVPARRAHPRSDRDVGGVEALADGFGVGRSEGSAEGGEEGAAVSADDVPNEVGDVGQVGLVGPLGRPLLGRMRPRHGVPGKQSPRDVLRIPRGPVAGHDEAAEDVAPAEPADEEHH